MDNAPVQKPVSAYLRRPLRSYEQALAEREQRLTEERALAWLRRPAANVVPLKPRRPAAPLPPVVAA